MKAHKLNYPAAFLSALLPLLTFAGQGGGYLDGGLDGAYYNNTTLTAPAEFTRRDIRLSFDWNTLLKPGGSMSSAYQVIGTDNYSVQWTGQLMSRFSETYTFEAEADDGVRVRIKEQGQPSFTTIIDEWSAAGTATAEFTLTAGTVYDIEVDYWEGTGGAMIYLRWSSPSTPEEVIESTTNFGMHSSGVAASGYANKFHNCTNFADLDGLEDGDITVDAYGWPTEDFNCHIRPEDERVIWGTYHIQFTGLARVTHGPGNCTFKNMDGSVVFGDEVPAGDPDAYNSGSNTTSFIMEVPSTTGNLWVQYRDTQKDSGSPVNSGISDIYMMCPVTPGSSAYHGTGEWLHRSAKESYKYFATIRWLDVNCKNTDFAGWDERTHILPTGNPDRPSGWDMGTAQNWEKKILWANETGTDLWITIPHEAGGDYYDDGTGINYFQNLAKLLKYGSDASLVPYGTYTADPVHPPLNPNLRCYIEFSNEVPWNTRADFQQSSFIYQRIDWELDNATAVADILNYDGASVYDAGNDEWSNAFEIACRYAALRTVDMSNNFRAIFGDAAMGERVRPIMSAWSNNNQDHAGRMLTFINDYFNNADGNNLHPSPHPVDYYVWGGGPTSYYASGDILGLEDDFSITDLSFENASLSPGEAVIAPAGSSWSFTGNAGVYATTAKEEGGIGALGTQTNTVGAQDCLGFKFTVGGSDVAVYEVGRYAVMDNGGDFRIYIVRASDMEEVCAEDISINNDDAGTFKIQRLSYTDQFSGPYYRPVVLTAGTTYYMLCQETDGGSLFYDDDTTFNPPAGISIDGSASGQRIGTDDWSFTDITAGNYTYGPLNLRIVTQRVEDATSTVNLSFPEDATDGSHALFLAGNGSASVTTNFPETGTYALYYDVTIRGEGTTTENGNDDSNYRNSLDVFFGGTRITPRGTSDVQANDGPWVHGLYEYGREEDAYDPYGSVTFDITAAGDYTITFTGGDTDVNRVVMVDNVRLTSSDAMWEGGIPGKSGATGDVGAAEWEQQRTEQWTYQQVFGLEATTYEGAWYTGDFTKTPHQIAFAYYDLRMVTGEMDAQTINSKAGMRMHMNFVYYIPQWDWHDSANYSFAQAWVQLNQGLPAEDDYGHDIPMALYPAGSDWAVNAATATGQISQIAGFFSWKVIAPIYGQYDFELDTAAGGDYDLYLDGSQLLLSGASGSIDTVTGVTLTKGLHTLRLQSAGTAAFTVNSLNVTSDDVCAPVTFDPPEGNYGDDILVSMETTTSDAEIWHTTDGSDPQQSGGTSSLYYAPVWVTKDTTIKARAFKTGLEPGIITQAAYTFSPPPPPDDILVCYDDFDAVAGTTLENVNTGYGWNGDWGVEDCGDLNYTIEDSSPLTYLNLATQGNYAHNITTCGGSGRAFDVTGAFSDFKMELEDEIGKPGTKLWFSWLVRRDGSGSANCRVLLQDGGGAVFHPTGDGIDIYVDGSTDNWTLDLAGKTPEDTGMAGPAVGETVLVVGSVTFSSTSVVDLYINPDKLGGAEPSPPSYSSSTTDTDFKFHKLWQKSGDGGSIDEIRFGDSFAAVTPLETVGGEPTVAIDQDAGQADPANVTPVLFTAVFSEDVTGFDGSDVYLQGTANPDTAVVSGGPSTYTVEVSGMNDSGTVIASIPSGSCESVSSGLLNLPSTSTDNEVTYEVSQPAVTVTQAAGQEDPTWDVKIYFDVVFSEPVTGFDSGDLEIGGTAGASTGTVSGSGDTYTVGVGDMTQEGGVWVTVPALAAENSSGIGNEAASPADNQVYWNGFKLTITTTSLPDGGVGLNYSETLTAANGTEPCTWGVVSGALPDGLALDSNTGEISGTPTTEQTVNFTVQVTDNASDTDTQDYTITINPAETINPASDLAAATVSSSEIDLAWTDNSDNEDGFKIERSPDGSTGWTEIDTAGADATAYSDTGLSASTDYYYRVTATGSLGDADPSNTAGATTSPPPAGIPIAYEDWDSIGATSGTSIHGLGIDSGGFNGSTWSIDQGGTGTDYIIDDASPLGGNGQYVYGTGGYQLAKRGLDNRDSGGDFSAYVPAGSDQISEGVLYFGALLRVETSHGNNTRAGIDNSQYSNGAGRDSMIYIGKHDISGSNYSVSYDLTPDSSGNTTEVDTGVPLGTAPVLWVIKLDMKAGTDSDELTVWADPASETDTPVASITGSPDGVFFQSFRLSKDIVADNISLSDEFTDIVPPSVTVPNAASGLTATVMGDTQIDLAWTDNSADESGFKIQRSGDGGSTYATVATVPADVASYSDTGLTACTEYFYQIVAYNTAGDASPSAPDSATTTGCGPSIPPGGYIIAVTPSATDLTLSFPTVDGKLYRLMMNTSTPNLAGSGWTATGDELTGDGAEKSFTISKPAGGQVFYTIEYEE